MRLRRRHLAAALAIAAALAMLAGPVATTLGWGGLADLPQRALDWSRHLDGVDWFVFAAVQALIAASGVLPASVAGIAAGAIYGVGLGFAISAGGTMAGAMLTLLLSRSLARDWVARLVRARPRLADLDRLLAENGVRVVCLLRLSPVMPFAATSYALGVSSVSARDYALGTTASLPALLGYVVLGHLGAEGLSAEGGGWVRWTLLGLGILGTAALTLQVGQLLIRAGLVPAALQGRLTAALRGGPRDQSLP